MAQLSRVLQKIFGIDGPVGEFGQIGSDAAGAPVNTKNLVTMQSLSQYDDGLFAIAPNADEPPSAEDINSIYNLVTSQLAYIFQAGVPEWETNTDYYIGSYVQVSGAIYVSLSGVDPTPNQGNAPASSPDDWKLAFPVEEFVYSQETFNNTIVRVAANQYKFRDDITKIRFQYISGGYLMTGGTSPLSGGDTWGYIESNNCKNIIFDPGTFIHMGNERGYIEVNTDDCRLENVNIVGTGTVASAILQSFLLNADYVTYLNCRTTDRLSTGNFAAFQGSSTASHNNTGVYINCFVVDMEVQAGTLNGGFRNCKNLENCHVINMTYSGAASSAYAYNNCDYLENCIADTMTGAGLSTIAFSSCDNIVNCKALTISSSLNNCSAFKNCDYIDNCQAVTIDSSSGITYGFDNCNNIKNSLSTAISSSADNANGYYKCNQVSNCIAEIIDHDGAVAAKNAYGFNDCDYVSTCTANDVDTNGAGGSYIGFYQCNYISDSYSTDNGQGFSECNYLTSCGSYANGINGYGTCNNITACLADNNTTHGFATCERVNSCTSTNNGSSGFINCKQISFNRSTGNVTQYNASYADFAGTQAAQDTAIGGYNG